VLVIGVFNEEGFATHIAETLAAMGHTATIFEAGLYQLGGVRGIRRQIQSVRNLLHDAGRSVTFVRKRFTRRLQRAASAPRIDLTIVCHDFLFPAEVEMLREVTGSPVILWFPDALLNFGRGYFLNARYSALFFKDPYIVSLLRRTLSLPVYYLPECYNPLRHHPVTIDTADQVEYGCDIATAGNVYSYRVAFFNELGKRDVKIWGNPAPSWMRMGAVASMVQRRYVTHDAKAKAFLCAKIVLNNLHPAEIWGINARAFEIAGIGGFQLIDWRPGLDQLFKDGEEIVSFRGMEDLRQKLDHYLVEDERRHRIATNGRVRAEREHTYEHRLRLLIDTATSNAQGYPLPDCADPSVELSQ
jgi:spore maturation protein CgeB